MFTEIIHGISVLSPSPQIRICNLIVRWMLQTLKGSIFCQMTASMMQPIDFRRAFKENRFVHFFRIAAQQNDRGHLFSNLILLI